MQIVHVKPGSYFVFVESVDAFHEQWRESLRRGEMLDVLACTDERSLNWGTAIGDLALPRRVRLNPATIQSGELFTERSSWRGEDVGAVFQNLVAAWEASRTPEERQAKALAERRRVEEQAAEELRRGQDLELRLVAMAAELQARSHPTVSVHGERPTSALDAWLIDTWEDSRTDGEMIGYRPPPTVVSRRALALGTDAALYRIKIVPITKENGPLRKLRFTVWDPPKHGEPPKKVVGERWGEPSSYILAGLAIPEVRNQVLEPLQRFGRKHKLEVDFKTPLSGDPR